MITNFVKKKICTEACRS